MERTEHALSMIRLEDLPGPFDLDVPEIYQIEVSSVCNFDCVMCPARKSAFGTRKEKTPFIELDLVKKIVKERSLRRSYFVELQMSGEPLLHPELGAIVDLVKGEGVRVGLSTNGSLIREQIEALLRLDYLTISVDSVTGYHKVRKGSLKVSELIDNINFFLDRKDHTVVDLQVIELNGEEEWKEQVSMLQEMFPSCNVRTVKDCFVTFFRSPDRVPVSEELCINPWLSCSIQSNGNVTACCFSFWDDIIYGNIRNMSLEDIWRGSEVRRLREEHQSRRYRKICGNCYMRSPALLHMELFFSNIRGREE